jgi:hypothetical protein
MKNSVTETHRPVDRLHVETMDTTQVFLKTLVFLVCPLFAVFPCTEPVFQYALNNWPADPYPLVVVYRGALSASDSAIMRQAGDSASPGGNSLLSVVTVNLNGSVDPALERCAALAPHDSLPRAVLCLPRFSGPYEPVWSGPLTPRSLDAVRSSPARRQIADRIIRGDAGVWLLVGGKRIGIRGNERDGFLKRLFKKTWPREKNERRIFRELESALKKSLRKIVLDSSYLKNAGLGPRQNHPVFSLLRIDRDDENEQVLLAMLFAADSSLDTIQGPIAFPMFGQGRVLTALADADLQEAAVGKVCRFIAGPCACTVKGQNPGFDLLIMAPWQKRFVRNNPPAEEPPVLTGLSGGSIEEPGFREIFRPGARPETSPANTIPAPVSGDIAAGKGRSALIVHMSSDDEPEAEERATEDRFPVLPVSAGVAGGVLLLAAAAGTLIMARRRNR